MNRFYHQNPWRIRFIQNQSTYCLGHVGTSTLARQLGTWQTMQAVYSYARYNATGTVLSEAYVASNMRRVPPRNLAVPSSHRAI